MRLECINTAFQVDMEPLSISQVHLTFFLRDVGIEEPTGLPNRACVSMGASCNHRILEQHSLALTDFEVLKHVVPFRWIVGPPWFQIPNARRFCHLSCKKVRHNPPWAYLKFLIFGAPVSSRTQRTKVRPWSLTGRQGAHTAQLHKIQGNEDVQAQCAVYGLHTPESTW